MYKYNAQKNAFYPYSMKEAYISTGTWPDKGIDVSDEVFAEFTGNIPEGKMRGSNKKGFPVWVDIPLLTKEEMISDAELKKIILITEANQKTQIWQTQLMLEIITDEDKASLTEWMLYVQKVQAVDTLAAPGIIWPEKPE